MRRFTNNHGSRRSSNRPPSSAQGFNNNRPATRSTTRSLFATTPPRPTTTSATVNPPAPATSTVTPPSPAPADHSSLAPPLRLTRPITMTTNRPPMTVLVALPLYCPELNCSFTLSAGTGGGRAFCLNGHYFDVNVSLDGTNGSRLHVPFRPAFYPTPPPTRPTPVRRVPQLPAQRDQPIVISDDEDAIVPHNIPDRRRQEPLLTVSMTILAEPVECCVCLEDHVNVGDHRHGDTYTCSQCWTRVQTCPICRASILLV
jgi:hypothetical protein